MICRRASDGNVEEWTVFLCNDVLLLSQLASPPVLSVHLLEHCSVSETHDHALEIADASSNNRCVMQFFAFGLCCLRCVTCCWVCDMWLYVTCRLTICISAAVDVRQQWLRWVQFAITVTKAKRTGHTLAPARSVAVEVEKTGV